MAVSLKQLQSEVDKRTKNLVHGYIRKSEKILDKIGSDTIIPPLIVYTCLLYYWMRDISCSDKYYLNADEWKRWEEQNMDKTDNKNSNSKKRTFGDIGDESDSNVAKKRKLNDGSADNKNTVTNATEDDCDEDIDLDQKI